MDLTTAQDSPAEVLEESVPPEGTPHPAPHGPSESTSEKEPQVEMMLHHPSADISYEVHTAHFTPQGAAYVPMASFQDRAQAEAVLAVLPSQSEARLVRVVREVMEASPASSATHRGPSMGFGARL